VAQKKKKCFIPVIPATLETKAHVDKSMGPYLKNKLKKKGLRHGSNNRALISRCKVLNSKPPGPAKISK
jgi:hypothetical protein